jgi:hypothetical protein
VTEQRTAPPAALHDQPRTSDVVRQVTVLVGAVVATLGAFWGSGAFGGESQPEVGDGALATDATLVAPAGPAFSIWSVIYTGLIAYAVWQALPGRRTDPRQRQVGWLVLGTMVLNALWIAVVQIELLPLSVAVILALLSLLILVHLRLVATRPSSAVEAVVLDGTLGLYLGWTTVATVANIAAVLAAEGQTELVLGPVVWSVVVLVVAAAVGVGLAVHSHGRLAPGAAITWGLAWIAVARSAGEPQDTVVALTAAAAAGVVALATLSLRLVRSSRQR